MKYFTLLLFFVSSLYTSLNATNIGGVLFSNTTLDSTNNPYYVTTDLQVPTGVELYIGPGVIMYFSEGVSIKTGGLLRMEGNLLHPIQLSPDSVSTSWGGLFFYDSAIDYDTTLQTGCFVNYIHSIKGGGATGIDIYNFGNGYVIKTLLSTVAVKNSIFENTVGAGFLFTQGGYFHFNEIFGNDFNMDHLWGDNNYMYFENNYIHDMSTLYATSVFTTGRSIIKNNVFKNCMNYPATLRVSDECIINNNQIIDCDDSWAIALLGGINHTIEGNIFDNNKRHIVQCCERYPGVSNNCFGKFEDYAIYLSANTNSFYPLGQYDCLPYNGIVPIDYTNNFFLGIDSANIGDAIFDYYDDIGDLFICNTFPVSSSCFEPTFSVNVYNEKTFTVYPNPTSNYINIQLSDLLKYKDVKVILTNSLGENIYSNVFNQDFFKIDIQHLTKGIYYVSIYDLNTNMYQSKKVVISY